MGKNVQWKILIIVAAIGWSLWQALPLGKNINLGLDLQGGMHLVLKVDTSELSKEEQGDATARALEVIRNRIDQFGVSEPSIQRQGADRIVIQLPGVTDRDRAIQLIKQTAHLEFKLVADDQSAVSQVVDDGQRIPGYEILYQDDEKPLLVKKKAALTGDTIVTANVVFDSSRFNQPTVSLELNTAGARKFARVTGDNVNRRLAIVLDGVIKSAPMINERIPSGRAQITGRFSVEEANDLAVVLRAGALPAPVIVEEERTVGPTLGRDSVAKGIRAILIGGVAVIIFMLVYYLFAGIIANIALCLNLLFIIGALSYLDATLTLPGIAGLVLTIGMAVDANVLIYERMREELRVGRTIRQAVFNGYKRATLTILDSNITTLITALILFQFGTGPIRGFAITLTIGIIASVFCALLVSRVIFESLAMSKFLKKLPMLQIVGKTKIDFIGFRKIAYFISLGVIIAGIVSFAQRGDKNFGIDFTGGSIQQYRFEEIVEVDDVREALTTIGLGDSLIQEVGHDGREVLIRTYAETSESVEIAFNTTLAGNRFELLRMEKVGPSVGAELREKALLALLYSLIGIAIYISIRFEFKFAMAALLALFHDSLVTIGALSLTGRELSLPVIAALLTMVGYSINDTIVVFDRIREDIRLMQKSSFKDIINVSINETLGRTLLTSITTLIVVVTLFMIGGEVINDFAFTLMIGVIVGTYSSIFVASPFIVDWFGGKKRA